MAIPFRMQLAVFRHILERRLRRREKYALVLELEPLFACNLNCAGCGKIQHPPEILKKRLSPQECIDAAEECGAPIVAIAGGEPLAHEQIDQIVEGLIAHGKYIYLCTNALLLERSLHKFKPSSQLVFSIHLDGNEKIHDRVVGKDGVYQTAIAGIKKAKSLGFHVMTNTTIFQGESSADFRDFFDKMTALSVDGMMLSPGYSYEKAPKQELFLKRDETKKWFAETLKGWRDKGWDFNHSPFYLDFLEGKRDYDCTPWGIPLRNIFGWQSPCYLMDDAGYAESYKELLEVTEWQDYGYKSGNPKCANCMCHAGYEPTAVKDAFSSVGKFFELAADYVLHTGGRKEAGCAHAHGTKTHSRKDESSSACGCGGRCN
ncbi:MAG: adenosyl-hopene transferase HpnH [Elusimicrobiota bacterium]